MWTDSTRKGQKGGGGGEGWVSPQEDRPPHLTFLFFPFGRQVAVREIICGLSPELAWSNIFQTEKTRKQKPKDWWGDGACLWGVSTF